jgi:hypothetical protein
MVTRFAILENGVVTNVVLAYEALRPNWVECPNNVGPGYTYVNDVFTEPVIEEPDISIDRQALTLSFAQLLIGLVTESWITQIEGEQWLVGTLPAPVLYLISTLPSEQQFAAKARAIRPSEVLRLDPLVQALAVANNKTEEELDDFFITYAAV